VNGCREFRARPVSRLDVAARDCGGTRFALSRDCAVGRNPRHGALRELASRKEYRPGCGSILSMEWPKPSGEDPGLRPKLQVSVEVELAILQSLFERVDELAAKKFTQHFLGKEVVAETILEVARDPRHLAQRSASSASCIHT
jgi:hypothetical protein